MVDLKIISIITVPPTMWIRKSLEVVKADRLFFSGLKMMMYNLGPKRRTRVTTALNDTHMQSVMVFDSFPLK